MRYNQLPVSFYTLFIGLYTYVDPRHEIRTVEYTADKNGFHPILNIPPAIDTPAVAAARSRHFELFNQVRS